MTKFAFLIHPLKPKDVANLYPIARYIPDPILKAFLRRKSVSVLSEIKGIRSKTGAETEGWFIGCPLTAGQLAGGVPMEEAYAKIVACADLAHSLGASLIGLGAFSSVVGDGGITVAERSPIAVTTGNSYTVATAIQGLRLGCERVGVRPDEATLAVVGATGSIGKTCARTLAPDFARTLVVGRDIERTEALAAELSRAEATTDVGRLREADAIITVTSAGKDLIFPKDLKAGAVVCDVARPRDVSVAVAKERPDVLVIEGGVVRVPGEPDFDFDFGFPEGTAYACMSETIMLALEGDPSKFNLTLGKEVSVAQVEETLRLAGKHGFELAGFRSFERAVSEETIARARRARGLSPAPVAA